MSRTFNQSRKEQGFKNQAHLDAFFRAYDHDKECPVCSKIAGYGQVDDGVQPYMGQCSTGLKLYHESH